jgi:hypothetical protein
MRVRELLPLTLRLQMLRGLRPAREAQLRLEELRGLKFGRQIRANQGCGHRDGHATTRPTNRLERYFDNHGAGPGIEKVRHYFEIYDRHFAKFVGSEVHVVEVGVSSGGSLGMWRDYFGAGCHVYGIDINPACKAHETESVRIYTGNQTDPRFWQWFLREVPRIDILIDDGGHKVRQQVTTFESVFTHIEPGGVYLCEDVLGTANPFHSYICGLSRNLNAWEGHATTGLQRMIGSIHHYPFVTVVEKPAVAPLQLPWGRRGTEWRADL